MAYKPTTTRSRPVSEHPHEDVVRDNILKWKHHIVVGANSITASAVYLHSPAILRMLQMHPTDDSRFLCRSDVEGICTTIALGERNGMDVSLKESMPVPLWCVKYANSAGTMLLGVSDKTLSFLSTETAISTTTKTFDGTIKSFGAVDEGRYVWVNSNEKLQRWNTESECVDFQYTTGVTRYNLAKRGLATSPQDSRIAYAYSGVLESVVMLDARLSQPVREFKTRGGIKSFLQTEELCLSGDEQRLCVRSYSVDRAMHMYDVATCKRMAEWDSCDALSMQLNHRGSHLLARTSDAIIAWDLEKELEPDQFGRVGQPSKWWYVILLGSSVYTGTVTGFDLSEDGNTAVVATKQYLQSKSMEFETVSILDLSAVCGMRPPVMAATP